MNPLRSLAAVLLSLPLFVASLRAAGTTPSVVEAVFATATTVPVTAVSYTATGNTVNLGLNFAPPAGTNLTVVNNTGLAFIQGTFDNLEQGQTVSMTFGGVVYPFVANYYGGTGNDLVLQWLNTRTMGWGYNFYGTLDTTRVNRLVPAPVIAGGVLAGRRVTSFSTASEHSLALVADGTVAAWGNNYFGPVGDGTNIDRMAPVSLAQAGVLAGRRMIAVKARGSVSLALGADGRVAAWGYNDNGALGNNVPGNAKTPTAVYTGGALAGKTVVAVTTGGQHCLALCSDGALLAWGLNSYGQLGDGTQVARMEPVSVNQSGVLAGKAVVAVAAGFYHSMVLCSDGTLVTWGGQTDGQLGNGVTTRSAIPVRVTTTGVLAGKTVAGMSAGEYHNVVVCTDGTVATWGRNYEGQLGNAGTSSSNVPVQVNRSGALAGKIVTAVAAGATHSMALCTDGTVVTWGDNANGQLGINSTTKSNVPVPVNCGLLSGERVVAVMAGSGSCFATVASPPPPIGATAPATEVVDAGATLHGSVSANGSGTSVAFEYGLTTACENTVTAVPASLTGTAEHPVSVALNGLRAGTTYYYRVAATSSGGTVRGETLTFATTTLASLDGLALNGGTLAPAFARTQTRYSVTVPNATAQVMVTPVASDAAATIQVNGATVPSGTASEPIPLEVGNQELAVVIAAAGGGNTQTYTVTVTRLPAEFAFDSATSVPVTAERVALAGNSAVFALRYAPAVGTRLTVVNNTGTEPIQGTFSNLSQGQTVTVVHGGIRYGFVANYFGGDGNDLVLLWANTRLLAWGANSYGVVGDGSDTPRPLPVPVGATGVLAGKTILSIAAHYQCFAVAADGTLAAWGKNDYGQLGDGTLTNRSVPVAVVRSGALVGMTVVAVSTGQAHSLALGADGTMAAWGLNGYGQLGDGTSIWGGVLTPVAVNQAGVLAGRRVVAIAAGGVHNLALCADGTLVAWGANSYGQCGDGSISGRPLPVLVDRSGVLAGKTIRMISAGDEYSLAVCSDGTVAAWGRNNLGQLGDQTTITRYAPVAVNRSGILAGRTVVAVSAASSHSLAVCADGVIAAWGNNTAGQLGNGGTTTSLVPVQTIPSGVLAGKRMIGVNGGYSHSIALGEDGSLAAWGDNTYAQLGYGGTANSSVPVLVNTAALRAGERVITGLAGDASNLVIAASPPPPLAVTTAATAVVDAGVAWHREWQRFQRRGFI
jgi:alpha-tubulin suppressor-like RCC1 family protein